MTLRLPDQLDQALTTRARQEGLSKAQAVEAAVTLWLGGRQSTIRAMAAANAAEDAELLERLAGE